VIRIDLAVPADVRFGAGRVSEVPAALAALGASRVLVVTGRTTARADAVRSMLTEAGISSIAFGVATEPSIERVRAAVERINSDGSLPAGVKIVPFYDRGDLVAITVQTVLHNLLFGVALIFRSNS